MATVNNCRKFEANIFNKAKCQNCFKPKETHSAEALECNKQSRKISKCGYLFVAPESFDFTIPLDKTRRWQRRFVVLYDDGELTYSVDENVNTVPQGVIDMNICVDVYDAENTTSHQYSICVKVPDRTTFIKGTTKDEINRWFDVLVMYPRSIKTKKHRRTPTYHGLKDTKQETKRQRYNSSHVLSGDWEDSESRMDYMYNDSENRQSRGLQRSRSDRGVNKTTSSSGHEPPPIHYRGIRSLKHKHDKSYLEGMKKSSSLHDLSATDDVDDDTAIKRIRTRSKSGDRTSRDQYAVYRRRTDPHPIVLPPEEKLQTQQRAQSPPLSSAASRPSAVSMRQKYAERLLQDTSDIVDHNIDEDYVDDNDESNVADILVGNGDADELYRSRSPTSSLLLNGKNKNETDERKMAKTLTRDTSSPRQSPVRQEDMYQDDLKYMKKGWLLKQRTTEMDWLKHWFVLSGSALKFYKDSRAEELEILDGIIDLAKCYEVNEVDISRNYGFVLKTEDGDTLLSAMTSGIRTNWMQALQKCLDTQTNPQLSGKSSGIQSTSKILHSSMPDRGITHPAYKQSGLHDLETLSQSYPAVRLRPKVREMRSQTLQENRRSLDLSTAGQKDKLLARHRTVDDYSVLSRRFDSDDSLERGSHDSLEHGSQDSLQSSGHSESSQTKVKRRRRRDKQHKSSCTWPYQSSDGIAAGASGKTPSNLQTQDSGSKSELLEYIDQTESGKTKKELSAKEQNELDNVEKNIRRIHRKSITEVQHHKPQHYDKFETGTAFQETKDANRMSLSERIMADYSREELQAMLQRSGAGSEPQYLRETSPSGSSQSSVTHTNRDFDSGSSPRSVQDISPRITSEQTQPVQSLRTNPHEEFVRKKSPSAKIKERTKAKQQQMMKSQTNVSLSPTSSLEMDVVEGLRHLTDDPELMNDIIEQKWKESDEDTLSEGEGSPMLLELESSGPAMLKSSPSSVNGETTVVDLLEIEVETLKTKLERTQKHLEDAQVENSELKNAMKTNRTEHTESLTDMEKDQSRYVNQINDIQNQMEHTTEYFQSQIAEHENRSEMAKLQLNSLRSQLQEARVTIATQQDDMNSVKTKLEIATNDLVRSKSVFGEQITDKEAEKQRLEKVVGNLESQVQSLETDLQAHKSAINKKDLEVQKYKDKVKILMNDLDEKSDTIGGLESDIQDVLRFKQELNEKSSMVAHLHEELDMSKQQLRAQDEVLQKKEKDYSKKAKELEDEYYKEKEKLEETIQQLKDRLNKMMAQSDRADSIKLDMTDIMKEKDETIAQLEEKLIENDTTLEEIKVELSEVITEKTNLQSTLNEYNSGSSNLKKELEQSKKDSTRHKNQLSSVNSDIQEMKVKKDKLVEENKMLHDKLEEAETQQKENTEEIETLKTCIHDYNEDVQEVNEKYLEKCEQYEQLQEVAGELEEACKNLQSSFKESQDRVSELESQLSEPTNESSTDEAKQHAVELDKLRALVSEYTQESKLWQDKYIEQCDECERLKANMQKYIVVGEKYKETVEQLENARDQLEQLRRDMDEQKEAFDKDIEEKYNEVLQSQDLVEELQSQLSENEKNFQEQSVTLEQLREKEFLQNADSISHTVTDEELNQKYKDTLKDLKQTRKLLQETERKRDELESSNHVLKQELKTVEISYQDQMNTMREKTTDLTNKLSATERRLKRYERTKSMVLEDEASQPTSMAQNNTSKSLESIVQTNTQLLGSSQAQDGNLQAKITALESSLSEAEFKICELAAVKQELIVAQTKLKDLSTQILDQRCLEIDLAKLKSTEISLREQNSKLEEDIKMLKEQFDSVMNEQSVSKDDINFAGRLVEVQMKFRHVQSTLLNCQDKIGSIITDLKSSKTSHKSGETLKSVQNNIAKALSGSETVPSFSPETLWTSVSSEDQIRIYAEKLALEALILGELAYNVKINEPELFGGQECVLYEMKVAKHRLLNLEQTVNTLNSEYCVESCDTQLPQSKGYSVDVLSNVLSQKLQLQYKISELIEKDKEFMDPLLDYQLPHTDDNMLDELGQEALFRIFLDEKLLSDSSHLSDLAPMCKFSQCAVQSDLAVIQSKIKENLLSNVSQKQKDTFVQSEIANMYQSLQTNQKQCNQRVCQFIDTCIETLAKVCAQDVVHIATSCKQSGAINQPLFQVVQKVFDKEQIQSEVTLMVNKYAHNYNNVPQQMSSKGQTKGKTASVIDCVQKETSELCVNLVKAIDRQIKTLCSKESHTMSPSERKEHLIKRSNLAMGLCNVVAQKSMVNVQVLYLEQLLNQSSHGESQQQDSEFKLPLKRNDSGVVVHSMSLPTSPTEQLQDQFVASLQQEAHAKSDIASYLLNNTRVVSPQSQAKQSVTGGLKEEIAKLACELVSMDRHMLTTCRPCTDYSGYLGREAVMQAQMSYSLNLLKMKHNNEMEGLKMELDSSQSIFKVKQDQRIADLEDEIDRLSGLIKESELGHDLTSNLDVIAMKEEYEAQIKRLSLELNQYKSNLQAVTIEKDEKLKQIQSLKIELLKYEEKLNGLAKEKEALLQKGSETKADQARKEALEMVVEQLETRLQDVHADHEQELISLRASHRQELGRSKGEMLSQLAAAEAQSMYIDEDSIRKKYMTEIERIKGIYDKGFSAMEKSHQKVLMEMRKTHKKELDQLRSEKDQLLTEETMATQAALDAMRKAHENELTKERNKFLDTLAKTFSQADVESLQRQHEENMDIIQKEIRTLSEQYSITMIENAALEKRVEVQAKNLHASRNRVQDLMAKNEELNSRLRYEIEKLSRMVSGVDAPMSPVMMKESDPPEMHELRLALRVKDAEILQLSDEMDGIKDQLQGTVQELEDSLEKYHELYSENQTMQKQHKLETAELQQMLKQRQRSLHGESDDSEATDSPRVSSDDSSVKPSSLFSDVPQGGAGDRSPSPKRSKIRNISPDRISSTSSSRSNSITSGRQLPEVPPEARNVKRALWRQRQPERARSNPGPIPLNIPTFSLPSKLTKSESQDTTTTVQMDEASSLHRLKKKKSVKIGSVDIIEEL